MKTHVLVHSSYKGGTGKTTLNTLTAEILAEHGHKVLLIDIDPNCSLSEVYGLVLADRTSKELIQGSRVEPHPVSENLDIIPGDLDMCLLANIMDTQLKNQLKKQGYIGAYDWIIIDPPGNWCAQTRNAIFAATRLIVTGTISKLDYRATCNYMTQLENCCIDADVSIVCNKYNTQLNAPGVYDDYQNRFGDFLYSSPIPDIKSLKRLTADPHYPLHAAVKKQLVKYVECITGSTEADNA